MLHTFVLSYSGPDVPVEFPEVIPYFDLESFPGVVDLRRVKDANSEPINIPLGLLFGDRVVTTAYVRIIHCTKYFVMSTFLSNFIP